MKRVKVSKKCLWSSIRGNCLKCGGDSPREVELCTDPDCSLYAHRFGRALKDSDPIYITETYENCYGADYMVNGKRLHWDNDKGWVESTLNVQKP